METLFFATFNASPTNHNHDRIEYFDFKKTRLEFRDWIEEKRTEIEVLEDGSVVTVINICYSATDQ
jgi:hypothetical protein